MPVKKPRPLFYKGQLSSPVRVGAHVQVRLLRNERKRWELAIIVNEHTTKKDLEGSWNTVAAWTRALVEVEGSDFADPILGNRLWYILMSMKGFSYSEIAMTANLDCLVNLCGVTRLTRMHKPRISTAYQNGVRNLLRAFQIKPKHIDRIIAEGLDAIQGGEAPWSLTNGPIDKQRVVDTMGQFESHVRAKRVLLRMTPELKAMIRDDLKRNNSPAIEMAERLLKSLPNAGGLDRLNAVNEEYRFSRRG